MNSSCLWQGPVADSCGHLRKTSGWVKEGNSFTKGVSISVSRRTVLQGFSQLYLPFHY
jgi:hypothetical protein